MALQDLTPQLRTRLSKVERAVGWFVILAALLLVSGFVYYAWHTAQRKGWFLKKVEYQTGLNDAAGIKVGDPVKLMGSDVGTITRIVPNDPHDYYGMTIYFTIRYPNYGYIWSDSSVKVVEKLLGNRYLEVTKGKAGVPTILETTNRAIIGYLKHDVVRDRQKAMVAQGEPLYEVLAELNTEARTNQNQFYAEPAKGTYCWVDPDESPAINERIEHIADEVEAALPNILALTNRLATVLDQGITAASNANSILLDSQPVVRNLAQITDQIRDPHGSLGEWLMPANLQDELTNTLSSAHLTLDAAHGTFTNADFQLTMLATELDRTLEHLSAITSNLNAQVAANTNLVKEISDAIVHADEFVQGLKRHWLFRSAFRNKEPRSYSTPVNPKGGRLQQN